MARKIRFDAKKILIYGVILAYFVLFVKTFLSSPLSLPPYRFDQDAYYPILQQMSFGLPLYVGIYDHKDFLFFYVFFLPYYIWGVHGPFVLENVLSVLMLIGVVKIWQKFEFNAVVSVILALLTIAYYFSETVYAPILTYHLGVVLFVYAFYFAITNRPVLSGMLLPAMIFAKMPLATLTLAILWGGLFNFVVNNQLSQFDSRSCFRWYVRFFVASLVVTLFLMLVLVVRGEFNSFIWDVVYYNFVEYPKVGNSFNPGLRQMITGTYGLGWAISFGAVTLLGVFGFLLALRERRMSRGLWFWGAVLALGIGTFITLYKVHRVVYHFHFAGLTFLIMVGALCAFVVSNSDKLGFLRTNFVTYSAVFLFGTMPLIINTTLLNPIQKIDFSNLGYLFRWTSYETIEPETLACIKKADVMKPNSGYMTIDQMGYPLPSLIGKDQKLECRYFFIMPWFTQAQLDEILTCIESPKVDWALYRPFLLKMPEFEDNAVARLNKYYTPVATCEYFLPTTIWKRKTQP